MTIMTGYNDTTFLLPAKKMPYGSGLSLPHAVATLLLSVLLAACLISARRWVA